jgi:hypothetical protein
MVAAIGAAVLRALGVVCSPPRHRVGSRVLSAAASAQREVVRPCLEFLLAATPVASRPALAAQCRGFLQAGDPDCRAGLAAAGYGSPGFTQRDAMLTGRLLGSGTSESCRIAGLCTVTRAAHYPSVGADGFTAALEAGLLEAVAGQLLDPHSTAEVRRLAVVSLTNLCQRAATVEMTVALLNSHPRKGLAALRQRATLAADGAAQRSTDQLDMLLDIDQI